MKKGLLLVGVLSLGVIYIYNTRIKNTINKERTL